MLEGKLNSPRKTTREEIELYLTARGGDEWKYFSASILAHWEIMFEDYAPRYLHGIVLDAGCGHAPYIDLVRKYSTVLISLDYEITHPAQQVCADVRKLPFVDDSIDSLLSTQVFEHVAHPFEAIHEAGRVLKSSGILLMSVPHLSRLHELPNDYFRFTENGLRFLAQEGGFEVIEIVPTGGLLTFLSHQASLAFLISLWPLRILRPAILMINKCLFTRLANFLDRLIKTESLFPQGYVMVAKKI
jgi:SAM-dependent methyltransferase